MKDTCGDDDNNESPEDVDIIKVDSSCFKKVVNFLKYYEEESLKEIKTSLEESTFDGVSSRNGIRILLRALTNQCCLIWPRLPILWPFVSETLSHLF